MAPTSRPPAHGWAKLAVAAAGVAAVLGAACAPAGLPANFPVTQEQGLAVAVVDSVNDVGRTPAVAFDPKGNPVVAYQLLLQVPAKGVLPAPVVAGAAQPPSVMVATQANGTWSRTAVTGAVGLGQKAAGKATMIANKDGEAIPGTATALAVDGQGKDHVAWSTPTGVFVSDNAGGSFNGPDQVTKTAALGISATVDTAGTTWLAYHEGGAVKVSSNAGGTWTTETVDASAGSPSATQPVSTAIRVDPSGNPIVAYGNASSGATVVATRSGGTWAPQQVTGPGGFAVSMALDKSGNPHLAYYDTSGNVLVADSSGGSSYQVTKVATVAQGQTPGPAVGWGTGIGVDSKGHDDVAWADIAGKSVNLASNATGRYRIRSLPSSVGGVNPSLAISSSGDVAVAWYDGINQNLNVAFTTQGKLTLAFSPAPVTIPAASPSAAACSPSTSLSLQIAAPAGASASGFDTKCLAVAAGKAFTVTFANNDTGVPHNWAVFTDPSATTRLGGAPSAGDIVAAGSKQTYDVKALQAGTYYFHCDIHPTTMNGTFVVGGK